MSLIEQMRAKWEAAGRGAADERAPLLANWYLGNRHAWWEAMEMVRAGPEPEPTAPEWFKAWLAMERQKDAARRKVDAEMAKPEPARPEVTREAVERAVTRASASPKCTKDKGHCIPGGCTCSRTIDAIMALIGGEA